MTRFGVLFLSLVLLLAFQPRLLAQEKPVAAVVKGKGIEQENKTEKIERDRARIELARLKSDAQKPMTKWITPMIGGVLLIGGALSIVCTGIFHKEIKRGRGG